MRLGSRLALAVLTPVAGLAAAGAIAVLGLSAGERALDRIDKAARQLAVLERVHGDVDAMILAALLASDPLAARAELAEAELDATQDLGVLDRLTEEEIDFVDPDEAVTEAEERDRPAALRQGIARIAAILEHILDRRLAADPAPDGGALLIRLDEARQGFSELVASAVADEAEEIAETRADRAALIARTGWIAAGLGAVLAGIGVWQGRALARQTVSGIEALRAMLARLADGRLAARVDPPHGDEIGALGQAANRAAEALEREDRDRAEDRRAIAEALERRTVEIELGNARLREVDATRRRFLGDLGHALKTPLAVARGSCENARTGLARRGEATDRLDSAIAAIDDVAGQVADLLSLARAEDGRLVRRVEPVELFDFLDGRIAALRALPRGRCLSFHYYGEEPLLVAADRRDLARACDAVLENALGHGGPDVEVTLDVTGGSARISVRDRGTGIPPELGEMVFDRHVSGRGGTGIGLAMARGLVEDLSGTLGIGAAPGGGTEAVILLPRIAEVPVT